MSQSKVVNHWGKWVDSENPITGVVTNNQVEWLMEEVDRGIDITLAEAVEDYKQEFPNANDDQIAEEFEFWDSSTDTILIGSWRKDSEGKYEPDPTGEYAAIVGEIYTQVVYSKVTKRCALCSPCYPGQGDLESAGEFLTYDLPADMYGSDQD